MSNTNSNVVDRLSAKVSGKGLLGRVGVVLGMSALVAVPGIALGAATGINWPASASYQLSYSADELQSMESAKALHLRIRRVALAYCPDYSVTKNLSERASCIKDVESDLVSRVNHPVLSKIHTGNVAMAMASTAR